MSFTHLHVHTIYSLLDSCIRIEELVSKIKETGMTSCAITDHGTLGGLIAFYKACKKANIKPLLGIEAYITDDKNGATERKRDNMHMILIAKDNIGYVKLLEIASKAALENFYYKARIYKEDLDYLKGHVVATSACLGGILSKKADYVLDLQGRAIGCNETPAMLADLDFYRGVFGEDFYLEFQCWDDGTHFQVEYNKMLLERAKKSGIPTVITCDAHYLNKEDHKLHELLMAMQMKMTVEEYKDKSDMIYGPYFYLATPEEMRERAIEVGCPEASDNTNLIANQCNVEIELGKWKLPSFAIEGEPDYLQFLEWKKKNADKITT